MATQDLSALFQAMQGGGGQAPAPNPLAQIMGSGQGGPQAPPQAPPDLTGNPAPPTDPSLQAPTGIVHPPQDPLQTQIESLTKQITDGIAQVKKPVQDALPDTLKDFDTYNEQRYQQTYGGGGVLGTAGRALANLLSGAAHKGQTIKERLTEENRKDWDAALKAAQMKVQQEKADQLAAIQQQAQQLSVLKTEQQNRQFQQTLGLKQQEVDIKKDSVNDLKPGNHMLGAQLIQALGPTYTGADDKQINIDPTENYVGLVNKAGKLIDARPMASTEKNAAEFDTWKKAFETENGHPPGTLDIAKHQQIARDYESRGVKPVLKGYDAQGQPIYQYMEETRSRQGSLESAGPTATPATTPQAPSTGGGSPAPTPGQIVGGGAPIASKTPLSEEQLQKNAQQKVAFDTTYDNAKFVRDHLDLLKNSATVEKLKAQLDPHPGIIKGLISRNLPMADDESKLLSAITQLTESINIARAPLGATGFRSDKSYDNLIALVGNIRQNPKLIEQNLGKTMDLVDGLRKTIRTNQKPDVKILKVE